MRNLKFLLDADMPRSSADVIRSFGYDVEDVRDIGLGSTKDREIIEHALKNNRIVITRIPILEKCSGIQNIQEP